MVRTTVRALALALPLLAARAAAAPPIGTDIASLNICLYGDCEARGAYAADPFGWANPATMPVGALPYVPRGVFLGGNYYRLNAGRVGVDIEAASASLALSPFVFLVTPVYAEGEGPSRVLPGIDLSIRTRSVRVAAAVDLDRAVGLDGFSVGLMGVIPGTTTDVRIKLGDVTLVRGTEDHEIDLTLGGHWRAGRREWFMVGGFLNAIRNRSTLEGPGISQRGTTDAWFPRLGVSILPFVPLGLAEGSTPAAGWFGAIRVAADAEHRNIAVPGEGGRQETVGYFGMDAELLPEAWNPLSRWLRVWAIGGLDTAGGWGAGPALYGNGPLEFVGCNLAASEHDLIEAIGDRVRLWSANCSVNIPF